MKLEVCKKSPNENIEWIWMIRLWISILARHENIPIDKMSTLCTHKESFLNQKWPKLDNIEELNLVVLSDRGKFVLQVAWSYDIMTIICTQISSIKWQNRIV